MLKKQKFHTFDALRFFAFLLVFLSHLPGQLFLKSYNVLGGRGHIGVWFFFTLSGFLITYIILFEKIIFNNFNFKHFITRRILRIWPLFYVMILFAYCTPFVLHFLKLPFTNEGYTPNFILQSLFLGNYQTIYYHKLANVSPIPVLWSLCVEEHFYILWGVILCFVNFKKIPIVIFSLVIVSWISRYYFHFYGLQAIDILTNLDFFMFGAIPAYLFIVHREKTIDFVTKTPVLVKLIVILTTITFILFSNKMMQNADFQYEPIIFGLLFCCCIFIFLPTENVFKINDNNLFSKLGIYTYGLYITHIIVINLMVRLFEKFEISRTNFSILGFVFISLIITIVMSYISYNVIEQPFLKLKKNYYKH